MGWDEGTYANRKALIESLIKPSDGELKQYRCLAHKASNYSNNFILWTIWEITDKKTGESSRYIGCDLIKGNGFRFMVKSMSESVGPLYYSCPVEYFSMVPEPKGKCCEGWRDQVKAWHTDQGRKIKSKKVFTNFYGARKIAGEV